MFLFTLTRKKEIREEEIPVVKTLKDYQSSKYYHREAPFSRLKIIVKRMLGR